LPKPLHWARTAHDELARLYETGLDTRLAQFDKRILTCFATTAADGFIPSKKALAPSMAQVFGVTPDLQKAKSMLKGLSKQERKRSWTRLRDGRNNPCSMQHACGDNFSALLAPACHGLLATVLSVGLWAAASTTFTALDWTAYDFWLTDRAPSK